MLIIFINKYIYVTFRKLASYRVTLCHLVIQTKSRNPYCTAVGEKNSEINFFNFFEISDLTPLLLNSLYLSNPSADFKIFCFVLCRNEFWTTHTSILRKIKQNKKLFRSVSEKNRFFWVPPLNPFLAKRRKCDF